ncbi:MAG: hypothetical protein Q8L37_04015 [Candidatus Gottesmanbacteria bacterium]|nr:hypothetical protein [Candidatus Gottesmanbacteria bacterium]
MLRSVLDTNVYLSGILFGGRPAAIVNEGLFGAYLEDNPIVETALVGNAGYIVTGDAHLLRLRQYDDVHLVTIDQFFRLLDSGRN